MSLRWRYSLPGMLFGGHVTRLGDPFVVIGVSLVITFSSIIGSGEL